MFIVVDSQGLCISTANVLPGFRALKGTSKPAWGMG
jgi:hypothetical protein